MGTCVLLYCTQRDKAFTNQKKMRLKLPCAEGTSREVHYPLFSLFSSLFPPRCSR